MAEIIALPADRLTPERRTRLVRQARVEMDRLWSLYRHAMADEARCPCAMHEAEKNRALAAWEPAFMALDAEKSAGWGR